MAQDGQECFAQAGGGESLATRFPVLERERLLKS